MLAAALSQLYGTEPRTDAAHARSTLHTKSMSSQPWGDKRWSRETKKRRLAQARAVMDQIDEKYKSK